MKCECTWPVLCGYIREFNIFYCTTCRGDVSPDRVSFTLAKNRGESETPP